MYKPEIVLSLDSKQKTTKGSADRLNRKLFSGADLRISTGFFHNEHVDTASQDHQLVIETSTFAETVLIDGVWSAYFMTLRQPVALRSGFGEPNSLSLFLYNQNGMQACAKLILDRAQDEVLIRDTEEKGMAKMHTINILDQGTSGLSKNFVYDFEFIDFIVDDCYEEIYANTDNGKKTNGNIDLLAKDYRLGKGIKVAIKGLSRIIWGNTGHEDEIYISCGSSYYYSEDILIITNTLPFVLVPADIPLTYKASSYRYCWAIARTDGRVELRSYNPFNGKWETREAFLPIRWFSKNPLKCL